MARALALLGLVLAGQADPIDPKLVGSWDTTIQNPQGTWKVTWTLQGNGEFLGVTRGPAPVPDDTGTFKGRDGKWSSARPNGFKDEGTYTLVGDTLSFTGKLGNVTFTRSQPALRRSQIPALDWNFGPAAPSRKGLPELVTALDALAGGSLAEGLKAYEAAIAADDENPDYHYGRGVVLALLERLAEADAELQRSARLRGANHDDTRMWQAVVVAMAGDFRRDSEIYPVIPTEPYQRIIRNMSRDYGKLMYFQLKDGRNADSKVYEQNRATARSRFPGIAAAFAERTRLAGGAGLSALIYRRGVGRVDRSEFAAGLRDLESILALDPDVPGALASASIAQLALGDPDHARLNLTRVLGMIPDHASMYLARALAEARLGNASRARADLLLAEKTEPRDPAHKPAPDALAKGKAAVEAELGKAAPPPAPDAAFEALRKTAGGSAEWAEAVKAAVEVHRAMNATRRRADERYAERHLELLGRVRANPSSADAHADLAKFLYLEAKVRATCAATPGHTRQLRYQTNGQYARERRLAYYYAEEAIALNPRHDQAIATRAWLLYGDGKQDAAKSVSNAGLAINPDNARLLKLKSVLDGTAASVLQWQADDLRSDKTWSTTEYRADGLYNVSWSRSPTLGELALAAVKQTISDDKLASASDALQRAARVQGDSAESWLLRSEFHEWAGNYQAMHLALLEALKRSPEDRSAHESLARIYRRAGHDELSFEHDLAAVNLYETSAGPLLERAWYCILKTKWKSAREILMRALALDPADARGPAYLAVVARAENQGAEALGWYRTALALEEARLGLMGRRSRASGEGSWPPAEDVGLLMSLRLGVAFWMIQGGRFDDARGLCEANLALEAGFGLRHWGTSCPNASLPDPSAEGPRPVESLLGLLLWSRLGVGYALTQTGKKAEAAAEFQRILAYAPEWRAAGGLNIVGRQDDLAREALKSLQGGK